MQTTETLVIHALRSRIRKLNQEIEQLTVDAAEAISTRDHAMLAAARAHDETRGLRQLVDSLTEELNLLKQEQPEEVSPPPKKVVKPKKEKEAPAKE